MLQLVLKTLAAGLARYLAVLGFFNLSKYKITFFSNVLQEKNTCYIIIRKVIN